MIRSIVHFVYSEMKACAHWRRHAKHTGGHQVSPMSPAAVPSPPLVTVPVPRGRRHGLGQLIIRTPGRGMRRVRILELAGITLHMRLPTLRHCARPHLWHHASHGLLHVPSHWESGVHRAREGERGSRIGRPCLCTDYYCDPFLEIGHPCDLRPWTRTAQGLCPSADPPLRSRGSGPLVSPRSGCPPMVLPRRRFSKNNGALAVPLSSGDHVNLIVLDINVCFSILNWGRDGSTTGPQRVDAPIKNSGGI